MKQEFGIECGPAKINLGGSEMAFEDGQWIPGSWNFFLNDIILILSFFI